eukprot:CAMPEP_0175838704 /NCGR_PEP_ID=MMETSP0107_2-20121207/18404_1 /TAXON_ID=195067 ORGANISM="Goniomonas pacifica, Strain CCMP1869" /NCGR_SAMPLE_ID=MMETSP0107_2 /ASSEMBLY_ACC=CAM_ASM_000203 /LENGTH=43 /DNA_ID= /DNA_START= /DNA_END= /DNA_ORIENTATION=
MTKSLCEGPSVFGTGEDCRPVTLAGVTDHQTICSEIQQISLSK